MFEDCFLLFTVPIRFSYRRVQVVNPKKVSCVDHALAASFGVSPSADRGLVLENIVFIHLRKQTHQIFYYKTHRGGELDFAVGDDDAIVLIQVCWSLHENEGTKNHEVKTLFDAMDEETIVEAGLTIHVVAAHQWLLR